MYAESHIVYDMFHIVRRDCCNGTDMSHCIDDRKLVMGRCASAVLEAQHVLHDVVVENDDHERGQEREA